MYKKVAVAITCCLLGLAGCAAESTHELIKTAIPVKTVMVEEATVDDQLQYVGIVSIEDMRKLSFKTDGRVKTVAVEQGQFVKSGDRLAVLESVDIDFAIQAAEAQAESASAQLAKAKDAMQYAQDTYDNIVSLYASGAVSKDALDQAKLNADVARSDVRAAQEQQTQAQVSVRQKRDLLSETELTSPFDGYITSVVTKEGELVQAGYPVVAIRSANQQVKTGLSQMDIGKIEAGMQVVTCFDDKCVDGVVNTYDLVPDPETRTYEVRISLERNDVPIGAVGDVKITVGEKHGIQVPITSVLSGAQDYVFIVEGDQVVKRPVTLGEIDGVYVFVDGLEPGEELVVEGAKNLKHMDRIKRVND